MSARRKGAFGACDALFDEDGGDLPQLREALYQLLGTATRLVGGARLGPRVQRLRLETPGCQRSLIVKELDPVVGHRSRLLAERWLPAVDLESLGPGLITCVADPGGRRVWHVYEDWGDAGLDHGERSDCRVKAAVRAIAKLHLRLADHPLLGECRLSGGDLGMAFYAANARDALRALEALVSAALPLPPRVYLACERLIAQLQLMLDEESARARVLEEFGGPETLVHGDLWLSNVFVLEEFGGPRARLIDWDHVGVSRFSYDLSTFLLRLPAEERTHALMDYEEGVRAGGWRLPDPDELNALFDTAERARIASHVAWPALALLRDDASLRDWALEALPEVSRWFEDLAPVLPLARSGGLRGGEAWAR
jgi:hypothetical protein